MMTSSHIPSTVFHANDVGMFGQTDGDLWVKVKASVGGNTVQDHWHWTLIGHLNTDTNHIH